MAQDSLYKSLGKLTEEMYFSFAKAQSVQMQDQLVRYHCLSQGKIAELDGAISWGNGGEVIHRQQERLRGFQSDFNEMKNDINSKYKIYIRGCGNAGKSTLLNALLSLDESVGRRMGRLPMTFIIDTYTDELALGEAQVRMNGQGSKKVTRSQAIKMEDEEEKAFSQSDERCRKIIAEKTKNVFIEAKRDDIAADTKKKHRRKTQIREIKWGIGKNNFFHNCILIDTPGLSQEGRDEDVINDVKSYKVDGIIWVISSEALAKQEVMDAYQKESQEMEEVYTDRKVIAVVNIYDYKYGSRTWNRVEEKARQIYCGEGGFDDLICVNAKMAYDGNLKKDSKMLEESNISELRKKINEMFTERSSEACHYAKLDKIDSFLNDYYKEVSEYKSKLEGFVKQYEEKAAQIRAQASACQNLVSEEKNKTVGRYLAEIDNRLELNQGRLENLDQEPLDAQKRFLNQQIIKTDLLKRELCETIDHCGQLIYGRFREQQDDSIISEFKTREFAARAFYKANNGLALASNITDLDVRIQASILDNIGDSLIDLFGRNDLTMAVQGVLRQIKNWIQSPRDRIRGSVRKSVREAVAGIDLSEEIGQYEALCMETLEKSMEQVCGRYGDMKKLVSLMDGFIKDKPHMEWEKVGIEELLGGAGYV